MKFLFFTDHASSSDPFLVLSAVCEKEGIKGYPTIKYFVKGKFTSDYNGGRAAEDFVNFLTSPPKGKEEL